ncbi:Fatty acyl-CoA synthetase and RNA processing-associated kinase 1 [Leucoagaricus sp. SymC.cos]|nr:Fatty acyl-CoA synthetase and RNA processing-associated kinase 1 [Leucoagaricus sp. SymC.cos]
MAECEAQVKRNTGLTWITRSLQSQRMAVQHLHPRPPLPLPSFASPETSPEASARSCSTSSSSLFSDIHSPPSTTGAKTHAFFASPFSADSSASMANEKNDTPSPARSLTADFFSTPVRTPSPPPTSRTSNKAASILAAIHPSRIFPSRYTSRHPRDDDEDNIISTHYPQKTDAVTPIFLDLTDEGFSLMPSPHAHPPRALSSLSSLSTSSSFESTHSHGIPESPDSSASLRGTSQRLPTPPPPSTTAPVPNTSGGNEYTNEPTPRPAHLEPFFTTNINKSSSDVVHHQLEDDVDPAPGCIITKSSSDVHQLEDDVDPAPGCIITTHPPRIYLPIVSPALTITPPPDTTSFPSFAPTPSDITPTQTNATSTPPATYLPADSTKLHLMRPLGQGAFSSVWLAQDHSSIPLTFKSKKSIRELRRKASRRRNSQERERERNLSLRSVGSTRSVNNNSGTLVTPFPTAPTGTDTQLSSMDLGSLARDGSLRMRNLRARVSGTRPVGFTTRFFLDERHGEMGTHTTSAHDVVLSEDGNASSSVSMSMLITSPPLSASDSTSSNEGGAPVSVLPRLGVDIPGGGGGEVKSRRKPKKKRLVAVKLTPRRSAGMVYGNGRGGREEEEERTRVGFVREVEILKHISHPNITVLLEHLSTPSHHILVLPYLPGGDLLNLVNGDAAWSKLGESVLRRIWCELCKAVGWMHGVGLVHRDIKLENILLTTQAFSSLTLTSPRPTLSTLPPTPSPLIKLSDFGLSRFIEIDELTGEGELLWTRCGSEAYAAPELVLGTGSVRAQQAQDVKRRISSKRGRPSTNNNKGGAGQGEGGEGEDEGRRGFYDARETDAWACGVVLYALVGRQLPFGEGPGTNGAYVQNHHGRIGGDGEPTAFGRASTMERRQWLMRIARGGYQWPLVPELNLELVVTGDTAATTATTNTVVALDQSALDHNGVDELIGQQLVHSEGAKRIVSKLLVRDPRRRARIMDLWEDGWMWGPGGGLAVGMTKEEWRKRERERAYLSSAQSSSSTGDAIGLGIDFGESGSVPNLLMDRGTGEDVSEEGGLSRDRSEKVTIDVDYASVGDDEGRFLDEGMVEGEEVGEEVEGEGEGEGEGEEVVHEELVEGEEGWLLDQEGIGSVVRQEIV